MAGGSSGRRLVVAGGSLVLELLGRPVGTRREERNVREDMVALEVTRGEVAAIVAALEFAAAAPWGPTGAHDGTLECWDRSVAALRALDRIRRTLEVAS